ERLGRKDDKAMRLDAPRWIGWHRWAPNVKLAVPALERRIREDPVMEIRRDAVAVLCNIAKSLKQPFPPVVLEALLHKGDDVRWQVVAHIPLFKTFAPGSVEVLLRCARSENAHLRSDSLFLLAEAAGKDRKVLEVIEKAKQDRTFAVRHTAYCAMFKANDRLDE